MKKIVDAIRKGDGDAAYKAALDHVTSACAIAEAVLTAQKTTD
jgi:DNA-binding GntR family transcriptional regulator